MNNRYNNFFSSFIRNIYRSVSFVSNKFTLVKEPSYWLKSTTSHDHSAQRKSDEEAIENDYKKIGQDLFLVLNKYEKSKGFRITER